MKMTILKHRYDQNLCKEIILPANKITIELSAIYYAPPNIPTMSKYKFSRAKWYEANQIKDSQGAFNWCVKNFGPEPTYPDAWSRWYLNVNRTFRFSNAQDYEWFLLRWA